ncbi:hypothetical protein HZC00_04870 [Candidatus Kaiserbacteria bacterium]|nr:hypothetical protein [Candidatus Kaiserbacteria bacterium]
MIATLLVLGCAAGSAYAEAIDTPIALKAFACFSHNDLAAAAGMRNESREVQMSFLEKAYAEDRCVPTILTDIEALETAPIDKEGVQALEVYPYKGLHKLGLSIPEGLARAQEDFLAGKRPEKTLMYVLGQ